MLCAPYTRHAPKSSDMSERADKDVSIFSPAPGAPDGVPNQAVVVPAATYVEPATGTTRTRPAKVLDARGYPTSVVSMVGKEGNPKTDPGLQKKSDDGFEARRRRVQPPASRELPDAKPMVDVQLAAPIITPLTGAPDMLNRTPVLPGAAVGAVGVAFVPDPVDVDAVRPKGTTDMVEATLPPFTDNTEKPPTVAPPCDHPCDHLIEAMAKLTVKLETVQNIFTSIQKVERERGNIDCSHLRTRVYQSRNMPADAHVVCLDACRHYCAALRCVLAIHCKDSNPLQPSACDHFGSPTCPDRQALVTMRDTLHKKFDGSSFEEDYKALESAINKFLGDTLGRPS